MSFLANLGFAKPTASSQSLPSGGNSNGSGGTMQFQRPQQQPQGQGNGGNGGNQFDANGNPTGQGSQSAPNSQESQDPLAAFAKMYDNPSNPEIAPGFTLDPEKMKGLRSQQDFMKGINPELLQRATSGDMQAMMEVMHDVSRNAYAASLDHGSRLTEGFVGAREAFGKKNFSQAVQAELTNNELSGMEGATHPVIRKHLKQVAEQMRKVYPDASPAEIAKYAKDFVTQMASPFQEKQNPQQGGQQQPANSNWDNWFES